MEISCHENIYVHLCCWQAGWLDRCSFSTEHCQKSAAVCNVVQFPHLAPAAPWLDTVDNNHRPGAHSSNTTINVPKPISIPLKAVYSFKFCKNTGFMNEFMDFLQCLMTTIIQVNTGVLVWSVGDFTLLLSRACIKCFQARWPRQSRVQCITPSLGGSIYCFLARWSVVDSGQRPSPHSGVN